MSLHVYNLVWTNDGQSTSHFFGVCRGHILGNASWAFWSQNGEPGKPQLPLDSPATGWQQGVVDDVIALEAFRTQICQPSPWMTWTTRPRKITRSLLVGSLASRLWSKAQRLGFETKTTSNRTAAKYGKQSFGKISRIESPVISLYKFLSWKQTRRQKNIMGIFHCQVLNNSRGNILIKLLISELWQPSYCKCS